MKKTLLAAVLLAMSGAAYAGGLETERAAGGSSFKMPGEISGVNAFMPRPGAPQRIPVVARKADEVNLYGTGCYLEDGDTVGVLFNRSDTMLDYSGTLTFYYYDKYGQVIDTDWTLELGMVWAGDRETIRESGVPDEAVACRLDARAAIGSGHVPGGNYPSVGPGFPGHSGYGTSCRIENGEAVGVVRNYSDEILRYSGNVVFYFYDSEDAMIDANLTLETGTVWSQESETITNRGIPLRAASCSMDLSEAVEPLR